jgi:hypothetical protein
MKHLGWFVGIPLLAAVLAGCASANLTLHLDLYAEDPLVNLVELTSTRIAELDRSLKELAHEMDSFAEDRQKLADEIFGVYVASVGMYVAAVEDRRLEESELLKDPSIMALKQLVDTHKKLITDLADDSRIKIKAAQDALDRYVQELSQAGSGAGTAPRMATQVQLLRVINDATRAVARLAGPLDTKFEQNVVSDWAGFAKTLTASKKLKAIPQKDLLALRAHIVNLASTVKTMRERGQNIPVTAVTALEEAFKDVKPEPGYLKQSFDKLILATTQVSESLAPPDALGALVRATGVVFNLVDRLQDPADPVWRTVSRPENQDKWRNAFTETYFYAEGNTSVVVVRDTPFSFRVLKATNNPTALVRGQLQISRAIADAAIAVAGAAAGAPGIKLPTKDSQPPDSGTDGAKAQEVAAKKAKLERQAAVRAETIRSLRRQLVVLRAQLERADATGVGAVLQQVQSLLKAHDTLLEPVAP